jgi:hypothetical protein
MWLNAASCGVPSLDFTPEGCLTMQSFAQLKVEELKQQREWEFKRAHDERLASVGRRSLRFRIGESVVRLGARLAGEPRLAWIGQPRMSAR